MPQSLVSFLLSHDSLPLELVRELIIAATHNEVCVWHPARHAIGNAENKDSNSFHTCNILTMCGRTVRYDMNPFALEALQR